MKISGGFMYKMNNFGYNGPSYDFGRSQGQDESFFNYENENYGWNYYPQTQNRFDSYEEYYKKDDYGCKQDRYDKKCEETKTQARPCFRPCFSPFPCFRNRNIDCREKRCGRKEWKHHCNCPCHDKDYDSGYDCREDKDNNNQFFFSGCIEFRNCNKR